MQKIEKTVRYFYVFTFMKYFYDPLIKKTFEKYVFS